jgi:hypothetical protein
MREQNLGADNPKLVKWLENYAVVLRKIENYAEAEAVEVHATRIRVKMALRAEASR